MATNARTYNRWFMTEIPYASTSSLERHVRELARLDRRDAGVAEWIDDAQAAIAHELERRGARPAAPVEVQPGLFT